MITPRVEVKPNAGPLIEAVPRLEINASPRGEKRKRESPSRSPVRKSDFEVATDCFLEILKTGRKMGLGTPFRDEKH